MRGRTVAQVGLVLGVVLAIQACSHHGSKQQASFKAKESVKPSTQVAFKQSTTYSPSAAPSYQTYPRAVSGTSSYSTTTEYIPTYKSTYSPAVAENGSYYGETSKITGLPKTTYVRSYVRKDGTYVRSHYRSRR